MYLYICQGHLYQLPRSCLICHNSKREKGLWTQIGLNSPPVSTTGHTRAGFCVGGPPRYGVMFGYKEGTPGNLGAVGGSSLFGSVGGEPLRGKGGSFSWLSVPNTICLVRSLLGHTRIPYLRQSSFLSRSQKKTWT